MSSLAIPIIFLIVSLIIDKAKDNKKNNKETVKKVKQKKKIPKQVYKGYNQRDNHIPKHESSQQQFFERKPRVIVDKEKEIFSNSLTFDKERIVNDIIFSEILSKPKSKR
ncbi:MAG: hypothetical protein KHY10_00905 [Gemella haemolysans]|jgi:hypothetical protein|uniref:Uncharacterized protein n=1 Tax=Gemella haemolysans TaxID=1379 RepID=A0A134A2R5_9BACL|nr:hypothetical protein [Gemella haemolysans]KXB61985.1 hypothetical protein HMPREF3186_00552 [Gemella haemolysans]MBS5318242.1 hypothetical protein [Gemella haemolysans]MDU3830936.1 hypothetical protein [Gemella haemolysans]TKW64574.1 MAG: hypothetical protein DI638_00400 [Gemella sp.]